MAADNYRMHDKAHTSGLWVFAYGSLMWRPDFQFVEARRARLSGWHRRFCIVSRYYRGSAENPGLLLGLDRGGVCEGVAFKIAADRTREVLRYLRVREQISGVYREARLAIRWAVEQNPDSTYLRFVNVPLDLPYTLPVSYALRIGCGVTLHAGADVALVGYGPLLMSHAWHAAELLAPEGISVAVINLPWLNRIDAGWVRDTFGPFSAVVTLDNHYVTLGQGVMVAAALARTGVRAEVRSLGLTDVPVCGNNVEVLAHHGLDTASIARTVRTCIRTTSFTG